MVAHFRLSTQVNPWQRRVDRYSVESTLRAGKEERPGVLHLAKRLLAVREFATPPEACVAWAHAFFTGAGSDRSSPGQEHIA